MKRYLIENQKRNNDYDDMDRTSTSTSTDMDRTSTSTSTDMDRTITSTSTIDRTKIYKQKIRLEWAKDKEFEKWIIINENEIKCKYCNIYLNPKHSGLKAHCKTSKHLKAMSPFTSKTIAPIPFKKQKQSDESIICEIRTAIFVALHTSIRCVDHIMLINKKNYPDSRIIANTTLGRSKCSAMIKNAVYPYFKSEFKNDLDNGLYSLIVDESTDISINKLLGIVIKFFSKNEKKFVSRFLKLASLEDCSASGIVEAIEKTLKEHDIPLKNMRGLGTDNASVMVGTNKGVIRLLLAKNSHITLVPCVCHSIQLAVSNAAMNCIPDEIDFLISETYNWFSKSQIRQNNYKAIYRVINDDHEPLKIVQNSKTRWLSIESAVKRIVTQWLELKVHFNIAKTTESCHLAAILSSLYDSNINYGYCLFLKSILKKVQHVNKMFESEKIDPTKLLSELVILIENITKSVLKNPDDIDIFDLSIKIENHLLIHPYFGWELEEYLQSKSGLISKDQEDLLRKNCKDFIVNLIKQLQQRIPKNVKILRKIEILSVNNALNATKSSLLELIRSSSFNFSSENIEDIENQWKNLNVIQWKNTDSTLNFWAEVCTYKNALGENPFKDLIDFAFTYLLLPISNAEIERQFSQMNLLKTKVRNRFKNNMINAVLFIKSYIKKNEKCCHDFIITQEMVNYVKTINFYQNDIEVEGTTEEDENLENF